jgi:RNA polymerase sigma-70 factor (ECF subfamily)
MDERTAEFERHRGRLFGTAYRMLGSRSDAEDIVQEAYLRWHEADGEQIRSPAAWLVTVVTRLCIDRLRVAAVERQRYSGPWLPEPIVAAPTPTPEAQMELASDLSVAFLTMLERLSPEERAVLLLRDVFDCAYPEIARILGKSEPACRQMLHRARERVHNEQVRFETNEQEQRRLLEQFTAAMRTADETALQAIFAVEATLTSDGGGKAHAARKIIYGGERVARLFRGVARKGRISFAPATVNGEPGLILLLDQRPMSVLTIQTAGGRIAAVYHQMNPDKLKDLESVFSKEAV